MNIVLLGPPGSGKGTQAIMIAQKLSIAHLSTGDMLREAIAKKTKYGVMAEEVVKSGNLVSDEIVGNIIKDKLASMPEANGFLFDGYPRNLAQADNLKSALESIGKKVDYTVYLNVDKNTVVKRIGGRRKCEQCGKDYNTYFNPPKTDEICDDCGISLYRRDDDNEATVKNRLDVYESSTAPLLDYYEKAKCLIKIEGVGNIEEINAKIISALK